MVERQKRTRGSLVLSALLAFMLLATGFGTLFQARASANTATAAAPGAAATPSAGAHVASAGSKTPSCIVSDQKGNLWFVEEATQAIAEMNTAGVLLATYSLRTTGLHCLVFGSDGNIWFTDIAGNIGQLNITTGTVTLFATPTGSSYPYGITLGSDGNVWFTEAGARNIGRITPTGVITEFPTAAKRPSGITGSADGTLWFTDEGGQVGNLNPATGTVAFYAPPTTNSYPYGITVDPADSSKIWFIEANADNLALLDATGAITEYPLGSSRPNLVTFGPDGNTIWFTYHDGIGNMTRSGVVTLFPTAGAYGIALGSDGNVWFTQPSVSSLANINPATGAITEYPASGTTPTPTPTPPPTGSWITPTEGRSYQGGNSVVVSVHATGVSIKEVDVYAQWTNATKPAKVCSSTSVDSSGNYTCTWDFVSKGRYVPAGNVQLGFDVVPTISATAHNPDGIRDVNVSMSPVSVIRNPNWAGYYTQYGGTATYEKIVGSWTEPSVSCVDKSGNPISGRVATWVGLGGTTAASTLEQTGTNAQCANGVLKYQAWYEMAGSSHTDPVYYTPDQMPVNAGDKFTAEVDYVGVDSAGNNLYVLTLTNDTQHKTQQTGQLPTSGVPDSADWMIEGGPGLPAILPTFGKIAFTNCYVDNHPLTGSPQLYQAQLMAAVWDGSEWTWIFPQKTSESNLTLNSTGFSINWKHS